MRRILARYIFVRSKDTKIRDFFRQIICVANNMPEITV